MIKGTGIDLVSVKRIERTIQRWGLKFILKVFTPGEIEYCEGKEARYQHYAARFAAKEAAVKMLGKTTGIGWKDIEVSHDRDGRPGPALARQGPSPGRKTGYQEGPYRHIP